MNMPVYRGFSETFDKYILGIPYFSDGRYYMLVDDCNKNNDIGTGSFPIDPTTLAIHFSDMLDSQGNKIFASLSEDGKGGDIITINDYQDYANINNVCMYFENKIQIKISFDDSFTELFECYELGIKIIGIQE